jgi:hypothetical protein
MGHYRSPQTAQADYFRSMERMIEANPHMVYVAQDKRALRQTARDLGIEYSVGDKTHLSEGLTLEDVAKKHGKPLSVMKKELADGIKVEREHTKDSAKQRRIALDHLVERWEYYRKLKRCVEKSEPTLILNLEKSDGSFFDPNSTENEGRKRLHDPRHFRKFYRRESKTPGISLLMGVHKETGKHMVQAVRFDKKVMPEADARVWWADHKGQFSSSWKTSDWKGLKKSSSEERLIVRLER